MCFSIGAKSSDILYNNLVFLVGGDFTSLTLYVHLCGHVWAKLGSQTDVIPQADPLLQRDFSVSLLRLRLRS
ncbi:hypothetical protein LWI28_010006 [Acer negundo]|uniref:Uncharacterized protein n=1 Tax=Acer negundo TaxID=4023 RepID=A0AAD5NN42_ACENE|nr:hypothetical protein LWI28_010006 [Acer negundo]